MVKADKSSKFILAESYDHITILLTTVTAYWAGKEQVEKVR